MNFSFFQPKKKTRTDIVDLGPRPPLRPPSRWSTSMVFLVVMFLVGAFGYGGWQGWRWVTRKAFYENPRFTLTRIAVEDNNGLLSPAQIIKASGTHVGQNAYALNLNQIRRDLELIPIVEHAVVRRDLPNQLTLQITERIPILRLAVYFPAPHGTRQQILYLDKAGCVLELPPMTSDLIVRYSKLPWLTGLKASEVRLGKVIDSQGIRDALKLYATWEISPASSVFALTQLDVSKPNQVALVNGQGSVVVLAPPDFPGQLRKLNSILADARARQKTVRLADLSVHHNIPVSFRD